MVGLFFDHVRLRAVLCGLCVAVLPMRLAAADELRAKPDDKGILSVAWENDRWANTDAHYTNGVRFSYLSPETALPMGVQRSMNLFPFFASDGRKRYSLGLGQSMFTPENIRQKALIVDDRPYAGWLYGTVGLTSDTRDRLDNLELSLGVVGPSAQAEPVQEIIHSLTSSDDPDGWNNQLKDEAALMLSYERKWRSLYQFSPFGAGADITPHVGGSLGNVFTQAVIGATLRVGFDLPADYGPPRIRPSLPGSDFFIPTQRLGGYVFAGFEGRAVAHNIFLDGNWFRESHEVDRNTLVGGIQLGAVMTYREVRMGYTHVFMSEEFDGQRGGDQFGAFTLSFRF